MGEEACQLTDWLRRIHLVAKESARVILVATHAADKDQHYNPLGILRDVEPHLKNLIVDQIEVDSLTGHNIDKLKDLIAKYAISLPHMGSPCPKAWEGPLNELPDLKKAQPITGRSLRALRQGGARRRGDAHIGRGVRATIRPRPLLRRASPGG